MNVLVLQQKEITNKTAAAAPASTITTDCASSLLTERTVSPGSYSSFHHDHHRRQQGGQHQMTRGENQQHEEEEDSSQHHDDKQQVEKGETTSNSLRLRVLGREKPPRRYLHDHRKTNRGHYDYGRSSSSSANSTAIIAAVGVRFASTCHVHLTISRHEYLPDELEAAWYTHDEYFAIQKECSKQVKKMNEGKALKDKKYCSRGLEGFTRKGSHSRKQNQKRAVEAVLYEQEKIQLSLLMASCSSIVSRNSTEEEEEDKDKEDHDMTSPSWLSSRPQRTDTTSMLKNKNTPSILGDYSTCDRAQEEDNYNDENVLPLQMLSNHHHDHDGDDMESAIARVYREYSAGSQRWANYMGLLDEQAVVEQQQQQQQLKRGMPSSILKNNDNDDLLTAATSLFVPLPKGEGEGEGMLLEPKGEPHRKFVDPQSTHQHHQTLVVTIARTA